MTKLTKFYASALVALAVGLVDGLDRIYYIAIEESGWDYAPSGQDLISNSSLNENSNLAVFTDNGPHTIGRKYKKARYIQYEDAAFKTKSLRPSFLGILGPTLRAEVGDKIIIHAKNFASRQYSFHPHGVQYEKHHEGALYKDRTSSIKKQDDKIPPGASYTYEWNATPEYGPTDEDPNCLTWAYHSHLESIHDTNSGLIGQILICRPGTLDSSGNRLDVDKEFPLLFTVFDENMSWYLDENIKEYAIDPMGVDKDDEAFQESNKMHGVNGLLAGNLFGIEACSNDTISWHLFGMGTEVDIHSVQFQGQSVVINRHRQDTVSLFPAVFITAEMKSPNPGSWDIRCLVNDHLTAGMTAKFQVDKCFDDKKTNAILDVPIRKKYFIGINEQEWNYAPSGKNLITGLDLLAEGRESMTFFERSGNRIGGVYKKAIFREFESYEFKSQMNHTPTLGILGPVISMEVGEKIEISVKNMANSMIYNIEPHGVIFSDNAHLEAGQNRTYTWTAPENSGPTELDKDCIIYPYFSSVDPVMDTNSGLVGPLLVCKKGTLDQYLKQNSHFLLFTVFDENSSHYLDENIAKFTTEPDSVDKDDGDFVESNLMHAINGLMYGNLIDINMCVREETIFHVLGMGTEVDMHSIFLAGLNINFRKENVGTLSVFPHTSSSTTIIPHEIGQGEILCRTNDHLVGGMLTTYSVQQCNYFDTGKENKTANTKRTYYIGAVEEVWDYFPSQEDIFGEIVDENNDLFVFINQEPRKFIGKRYLKALYYEYTDETFSQKKKKSVDLGFLGPVISAEEGDEIQVIFKNMASRPYSINPWGAQDEDFFKSGVKLANPEETVKYIWKVPDSIISNTNHSNCNSWMYMSNVDSVKDQYSGLVGPLLICRKGYLTSSGPRGVDKSFYLLFMVSDENKSHYLENNIRMFAKTEPEFVDMEDEDFVESNLMHGINGRLEHLEGLTMHTGDKINWHLLALGTEVDLHTVHFHAHAFLHASDKDTHGDVFSLFPGKVATVEMNVNELGKWLLHCHVNDHVEAGMRSTYSVQPRKEYNEPPCYARKGWGGNYELYCNQLALKSSSEIKMSEDGMIEVCSTSQRKSDFCSITMMIDPTRVYYIDLSGNYGLLPEEFHECLNLFPKVEFINAANIGLGYILHDSFWQLTKLRRINLMKNKLKEIPDGLFQNNPSLSYVNLSYNDLYMMVVDDPGQTMEERELNSPFNITVNVNLNHNPRLGSKQKIFKRRHLS